LDEHTSRDILYDLRPKVSLNRIGRGDRRKNFRSRACLLGESEPFWPSKHQKVPGTLPERIVGSICQLTGIDEELSIPATLLDLPSPSRVVCHLRVYRSVDRTSSVARLSSSSRLPIHLYIRAMGGEPWYHRSGARTSHALFCSFYHPSFSFCFQCLKRPCLESN
jgi:hypothetical protein